MRRALVLSAAFATAFGIDIHDPTYIWRDSVPTNQVGEELQDLVREANRDPTASRAVPFSPFARTLTDSENDPELSNQVWLWHVNVTDIPVPAEGDDDDDDPAADTNTHVVSTTWSFSWRDGEGEDNNITSVLGGRTRGVGCFSSLVSADPLAAGSVAVDYPVNVTNSLTEDDANSMGTSCTAALGSDCVDALLRSYGGAYRPTPDGGSCQPPAQSWTRLPECAGTLGAAAQTDPGAATFTMGLWLDNEKSANTSEPAPEWVNGFGFHGQLSGAAEGARSGTYLAAENQLHILMVSLHVDDGGEEGEEGGRNAVTGAPVLLCTRVNATELPDGGSEGGDDVMLTSEAVLESEESSGGAVPRGSAGAALVVAALASWAVLSS